MAHDLMPLPSLMLEEVAATRVLVADDQPHILEALSLLLAGAGFEAHCVSSVQGVRDCLHRGAYDLLLMDLDYTGRTTAGVEGLELIAEVRRQHPSLPIVVMTGCATIELAVEAMRRGARTLVQKPWDNAALTDAIAREIGSERALRRAGARASRELADARAMQRALLPTTLPSVPGCDVAALWRPAGAIGGDGYDVRRLGDTRLALSIADVAGKGTPAALLLAHVLAASRAYATATTTPGDLLSRVNRALCGNAALTAFVTACHAVFDAETCTLAYSIAGHAPPVLVRANGTVVRLDAGGPVLGVMPEALYAQEEVALEPGDRVLFFTDGVTEARAADGTEFGDARLIDLVLAARHCCAQRVLEAVFDGVCAFSRSIDDDVALMALAIGPCRP